MYYTYYVLYTMFPILCTIMYVQFMHYIVCSMYHTLFTKYFALVLCASTMNYTMCVFTVRL